MPRLDYEAFIRETHEFDAAVRLTPAIDRFCSSSAWIVPARLAFHPETEPFIFKESGSYLTLARTEAPGWGHMLMPLEACWCLSATTIGPQLPDLLAAFHAFLVSNPSDWDTVLFTGIVAGSEAWRDILRTFADRGKLYQGPLAARRLASLTDGFDGYFGRRTAKFRNNQRRVMKKIAEYPVTFRAIHGSLKPDQTDALFHDLMTVESKSWKGLSGQGVDQGAMRTFYKLMLHALAGVGRIRAILAFYEDQLAGYIVGGLFDRVYRGFQFSFDQRYRHLSLGNALQLEMIERLCAEGIRVYDLGMDIEYKQRWAEYSFETASIILRR